MRRLIIADKQDISRLGIEYLVDSLKTEISDKLIATSKRQLIDSLLQNPQALVIIDYSLFDFSNTNELVILRNRFPFSDWIFFSDDLNDNLLNQIIYSEYPFSIILKESSVEEIIAALTLTAQKQRFICNQITNHLLTPHKKSKSLDQKLTVTEQDILKDIASGKTTKEIASARNISTHTVVSHRKNIFRKLEVNSVFEATRYAVRAGIVDIAEYYI